jgi:hypothetical protein
MKTILFLLVFLCSLSSVGQYTLHTNGELDWNDTLLAKDSSNALMLKTTACGSSYISSGYPLWTNYWAGYMVNIINNSTCPLVINSFESRFQGTSGYRIYTKAGTFVGFETNPSAWTLVGNITSGLTGISTISPTPIPITVNIIIPSGGIQAFYLTRPNNLVENRHLYVPGTGTAGTTIYASDANISITEGSYIDPYFAALNTGVRRPSLDVCYSLACSLPVEIFEFDVYSYEKNNNIHWMTASEINNEYFSVERSEDGINWIEITKVNGAGNSNTIVSYEYIDRYFSNLLNYYRLKQTDFNGAFKYSDIVSIDNSVKNKVVLNIVNSIGQEVDENYCGIKFVCYSDGTVEMKL